jgi:hypothetical protein
MVKVNQFPLHRFRAHGKFLSKHLHLSVLGVHKHWTAEEVLPLRRHVKIQACRTCSFTFEKLHSDTRYWTPLISAKTLPSSNLAQRVNHDNSDCFLHCYVNCSLHVMWCKTARYYSRVLVKKHLYRQIDNFK